VGVGGVAGRRSRGVDVGVEAVADAEAGVVDVAVDVVGEQDRGEGKGGDEDEDRAPDEAPPQPRRRGEDPEVGGEAGPDQAEGELRIDRRYPPAFSPPPTLCGPGGGGGTYGS
jgi:hypothetical protein